MARVSAQPAPPAPNPPQPAINPETGLPEPVPQVDLATGLPANGSPPFKDSTGAPTWINPAWPDSGKVLPSVEFAQLPVTEIARFLLEHFTNAFDIILPNPSAQGGIDPSQISIDLRLKDVTATEIFSAMNVQFELDNSPYRWELRLNGSRPTAIIRYLPQLVPPPPAPPPPPPTIRKVFFVGDMLEQFPGTNDAVKLGNLADIILRVAVPSKGRIKVYPPGQLLIVSGTADQVELAEQTLRALKEKAQFDKTHSLAKPEGSQ